MTGDKDQPEIKVQHVEIDGIVFKVTTIPDELSIVAAQEAQREASSAALDIAPARISRLPRCRYHA